MTIQLARDVEEFLDEQLRSGHCADAAELVNDVLRSVKDQHEKRFNVSPKLEAWLLEAVDRPITDLTKDDFVAIRERARKRNLRRAQ
jgi:Arc/MetJ-type ribon-helix-helix transcriptional regulator